MNARQQTVLIVDDNMINVKVVQGFLKHRPEYRELYTTDSREVVDICRNQPVDMVLLDIMMPELDGYQVCEQLKQLPETRDIPIIFLTAKQDAESIVRGFEVGAVDYLSKPLNGMELLARMDAHLRLRQQEQELKRLNRTKDRLLGIIAERMGSPIRGLRGILAMLDAEGKKLSEEQLHEYIKLSNLAADNLARIADNLMQWASLNEEELPLLPESVDLFDMVRQLVEQVSEENQLKEVKFEVQLPDESLVYADRESLHTVILNLLNNAVAFSHKGGQVQISGKRDEGEMVVAIRDEGVGIGEEEQTKLFNIEEFVSSPGTDGETGCGLGLVLSQELLRRNQGRIWIESEKDRNTTVFFTLPQSH